MKAIAVFSILFASMSFASTKQDAYTFRMRLNKGQTVKMNLMVEREATKTVANLAMHFYVPRLELDVIVMEIRLPKLEINGVDRTKDLKSLIGNWVGEFSWTTRCQRAGGMKGLTVKPGFPDVQNVLNESGLYLSSYLADPVKIGHSWYGAVTATGGCVAGKFKLTGVTNTAGKRFAYFEVTEIQMRNDTQVGPMYMTVDMSHGLPTRVEYRAKSKKTGKISKFVQTLISIE